VEGLRPIARRARTVKFSVGGVACILLMLLLISGGSDQERPEASSPATSSSLVVETTIPVTTSTSTAASITTQPAPVDQTSATDMPLTETGSIPENRQITFFNGQLSVAAKSVYSGWTYLNARSGETFCEPSGSIEVGEFIVLTGEHRYTITVTGFGGDTRPRTVTVEIRRDARPSVRDASCRFVT